MHSLNTQRASKLVDIGGGNHDNTNDENEEVPLGKSPIALRICDDGIAIVFPSN